MAISQKLKEIYSNYDNMDMYYEAIELSHPNFAFNTQITYPANSLYPSNVLYPYGKVTGTGNLYPSNVLYPGNAMYPNTKASNTSVYLIKANDNMKFNVDGQKTLFLAYPFGVVTPNVGDDNQDLQVVFDNVSRDIIEGVESAARNPEIPIKMRYFIFADGTMDTQITPISLNLTNVSADVKSIQATAQRADLFKYKFPQGGTSMYDSRFKGLYL